MLLDVGSAPLILVRINGTLARRGKLALDAAMSFADSDLTRFRRLVALSFYGRSNYNSLWRGLCDCGTENVEKRSSREGRDPA